METSETIKAFFEERQKREDDKKEISDEMKEGLEAFCNNYRMNKKALLMAYKLWKEMQKDRHEAESTQFEYDKLAELIVAH